MFKTPDLFIMNPLEYDLPQNLTDIILCAVMLIRRHKINIYIHVVNTMFTEMAPLLGVMLDE